MQISYNISLRNYNTFGMDATAAALATYDTPEELVSAVRQSTLSKPILHIGEGSNLLFTKDFPGTILMNNIHSLDILEQQDDSVLAKVGGGWKIDDFIAESLAKGWYGIENLSLIPGQVGASAVQNIGAYGVEAGDCIHAVHCVSLKDGSRRVFSHDECRFAYRHSIFKTQEMAGIYAITHVEYRLNLKFKPHLDYGGIRQYLASKGLDTLSLTAQELREAIIAIRQAKLPDPKELGNAGSFFMNPIISEDYYKSLCAKFPEIPSYKLDDNRRKIPAAWLIEQCGWKGRALGNAGVHAKQPLVLVNLGSATAQEIQELSKQIVADVNEKFGISIHPEVLFV